ncbi:Glycerophosphodiester phosphodiesterase [Adhaeribacter pallidiroseus]|uniref:Glycerophosphodiester phosphodiesterase n=1 Tax=Adhaeribacter pallidiroseus TaxID=2072847 RepID=A0A369QMP3_9BACT|nr:Glycerophosphodiester phosphodiesterase [Adhaeribacter pallidiroseus]
MPLLCFRSLLKKAFTFNETGPKHFFLNFNYPARRKANFFYWEHLFFKNLALLGLLLAVNVLLTGCSPDTPEKIRLVHQKRKVMLTAHRGASGVAPENTLAAIQKALDSPADFIEIDIHQTQDSQLVVMHDATLDRTTTGQGAIAAHTLADIKKLDAGSWFKPEFKNEQVPTLEEVLRLVKGRKKLLIELKKGRDFYPGMANQVIALLRQYRAREWCVLQSFHDEILQQIWQNEYHVPTHKLMVGKLPLLPVYFDTSLRFGSFDKYYRASAINVHYYFASRRFVKMVHNAGFKTFVWTVDDPAEINKLVNRGVDGIMSNAAATLAVE